MTQEEEFERFERKGEFPHKKPLEPDELFSEKNLEHATIEGMHVPKDKITKQSLKVFLIELKPIIQEIQSISRTQQHQLGQYLDEVNKLLKESNISKDILTFFEKMTTHFHELLKHSAPKDQSETLFALQKILSYL